MGRRGPQPNPNSRDNVKKAVRKRDGHKCTECGMTREESRARFGRTLDVHRLIPGSRYTLSGCVTLCRECHKTKPKLKRRQRSETPRRIGIRADLAKALALMAKRNNRPVRMEFNRIMRMAAQAAGVWPSPQDED